MAFKTKLFVIVLLDVSISLLTFSYKTQKHAKLRDHKDKSVQNLTIFAVNVEIMFS